MRICTDYAHFFITDVPFPRKDRRSDRVMENETAATAAPETAKQSVEERIVIRMRKCGKILLKNSAAEGKAESGKLLSCLDEREKKELSYLLKKCLNDWQREKEE